MKYVLIAAEPIKQSDKAVQFAFTSGYAVKNTYLKWLPKSQLAVSESNQKGMYADIAVPAWLAFKNDLLSYNEFSGYKSDDRNLLDFSDETLKLTGFRFP